MSGSYFQRRENDKSKLAEARRLYHHVCNGGTLTPEDVSFMVVALEESYEQVEVDRLRAKKKAIHEDLFKDICKAIDEIEEAEIKQRNKRKYKW